MLNQRDRIKLNVIGKMFMEKNKILVVDDDVEVGDLVEMTLVRDEFSVVRAEDGDEGYEKAIAENPVLIITDIDMPRVNGLTLCRNIRENKSLHLVPIIMLTGSRTLPQDRIEGLKIGADDYISKPFLPEELSIRVGRLIDRTRETISVNPLTKLPGSYTLEDAVNKRIAGKQSFAACYIDINHFKAGNDHYGYAWGDQIIKFTAKTMIETINSFGGRDDLVIHIGGDDFIVLTTPEKADSICENIVKRFDGSVPGFYNEEDKKRGCINILNRKGQLESFRLMSLSVAIATNEKRKIENYLLLADILKELKQFAKSKVDSFIAKDRRT
jgi:diguanylate cyclase (GGDEF)-like protein